MREITGHIFHYLFGGIFLIKILHVFDFFLKKFTPLGYWYGSALPSEPSDDSLELMYRHVMSTTLCIYIYIYIHVCSL